MNSSKSENSASPSRLTDQAARENALARDLTPTYESATFSRPVLDQFRGLMPDFNKRLSPVADLGLSPSDYLRLSPETLPRLISSSCTGIRSAGLPKSAVENPKIPAGKGLEILPDLPDRKLSGANICSLTADFPISPLSSRLLTLRCDEDGLKKAGQDKE